MKKAVEGQGKAGSYLVDELVIALEPPPVVRTDCPDHHRLVRTLVRQLLRQVLTTTTATTSARALRCSREMMDPGSPIAGVTGRNPE